MITTELKVKIRRTGTWGEVRGSGEVVGMLGEIVRICWNLTAARCHRVAISLSHSFGTALCTLAPPGFTFGCDLETVEPRSDAFVADYFTVDENNLIARSPRQQRPLLLALLWSAKESALKALRVGLWFDTRCMSVSPVDDWHPNGNPDTWRSLRVRYSGGMVFHGCWRIQDHLVRTVVSDLSLPIPVRAHAAHLSMA
jgi:4'-phosphopantetheinyl transferase